MGARTPASPEALVRLAADGRGPDAGAAGERLAALAAALEACHDESARLTGELAGLAAAWEAAARPWQAALARGGDCLRRLEAWHRWLRRLRRQGGLSLPLWRARPGGPAAAGGVVARRPGPRPPRWSRQAPARPPTVAPPAAALVPWRRPADAPGRVSGPDPSRRRALKQIWRRLAWHHHPDRAHGHSAPAGAADMRTINALYAAGELELLVALSARLAAGGQPDAPPADEAGVEALVQRHLTVLAARLERAEVSLRALRATPVYTVWRHLAAGGELAALCAEHWQAHLAAQRQQVYGLADSLEECMHRPQRPRVWAQGSQGVVARPADALATVDFAPAPERVSDAQTAGLAAQMIELMAAHPPLAALFSLAYLAGEAASTLLGLERFGDWDLRMRALSGGADEGVALEEALVDAVHWVEWGVRPGDRGDLLPGLCFVPAGGQAAMAAAADDARCRAAVAAALEVLGEHGVCGACRRPMFFVALWRLAGVDALRALVCPACGHRQRAYRLACGEDVPSALGGLALELGLVHEVRVAVPADPRASFTAQLAPVELETLDLGGLTSRLAEELFARRGTAVAAGQLRLVPTSEVTCEVGGDTPLASLPDLDFALAGPGLSIGEWRRALDALAAGGRGASADGLAS